jgi:hypothetical protein
MSLSNSIIGAVGTATRTIGEMLPDSTVSSGLKSTGSALESASGNEVGGVSLDLDQFAELKELIDLQVEVQKEMQAITMVSNIEKSKHESKMSAIRNVRTS